MPITIEEVSTKELMEIVFGSRCPSDEVHRWEDDYVLGSICNCSTWQIVELINSDSFWAINCNGQRQIFDRSEI